MRRAVDANELEPMKNGELSISHLMFADDLMVFAKADERSARYTQSDRGARGLRGLAPKPISKSNLLWWCMHAGGLDLRVLGHT